ncbi:MAG: PIN domain-containing protein [Verrucomicrobiales bacterium]
MSPVPYIDSSVFLRYFLADDPVRSVASRELILQLESGEASAVTDRYVIFEVVFTLGRKAKLPKRSIQDAIGFLLLLPGLEIPDEALIRSALALYVEKNISFADAYICEMMADSGIDRIYTWDSHFDRVPGIVRLTPGAE